MGHSKPKRHIDFQHNVECFSRLSGIGLFHKNEPQINYYFITHRILPIKCNCFASAGDAPSQDVLRTLNINYDLYTTWSASVM